jgi:hypothetical protein
MKYLGVRSSMVISLLVLVLLVSLTGACKSNPPASTEDSGPSYQPFSNGLCGLLRIEDFVAEYDLALPSTYEPSDSYFEDRKGREIFCHFATVSDSDRFATLVTRFEPAGGVLVKVFQDPADTRSEYRRGADAFERGRESIDATLGPAAGWWDEGENAESVRDQSIERFDEPDEVVSNIIITYIAYHENLYLHTSLDATSDPEDVEEATAVLHEMVRALMDEAVSHLTLTE